MPYLAANAVPVTLNWGPRATFPTQGTFRRGFTKFDVTTQFLEIVAQLLEEPEGWKDDQAQEMYCGVGFSSVPVDTPFVAIRFRVYPATTLGTSGSINVRLLR